MEPDIWEKLFPEKRKKKDGKFLLPQEWTRAFSKKKSEVNPFCCMAFNRHSLSKRASHIFSAPFRCTIAGCTTKEDIYLYPDIELVIKHSTNIVQHRKNQYDSFRSRKITGSQREALKTSLLDCPFLSKEYDKNLSQLDDCNFNASNLCDVGNSTNVYKQINRETLKTEQKYENTFLNILK